MGKLARIFCIIAGLSIPVPALGQAAGVTPFDGFYRGVSRQVEAGPMGRGNTGRCPTPDGRPAPLRIVNGVARAGSAETPMEGSVTPDGVLVMRSERGAKFEGRIDHQGMVAGRLNLSCSYQLVWQRQ